MISICSQQCNYSMKRHRFYCFISFSQNADVQMSGKRRKSTIDQNGKTINCTVDKLSTSRCIKTVIMFQQHFVFNIKIKGSVQCEAFTLHAWPSQHGVPHPKNKRISLTISENWEHYQCTRETDAHRWWQTGHGEPWTSRRDETRRIQCKAFLFGYSPSQLI